MLPGRGALGGRPGLHLRRGTDDDEQDRRIRQRSEGEQGLERREKLLTLPEKVEWDVERLLEKRDRLKVKTMAERDKRISVLLGNSTPDEDDIEALGLEELPLAERTQHEKDTEIARLRQEADQRLRDLDRRTEEQVNRRRDLWFIFDEMVKKTTIFYGQRARSEDNLREIELGETFFRELRDRYGSPFGDGVYFRGSMGARGHPGTFGRRGPRGGDGGVTRDHPHLQGPEADSGRQAAEGGGSLPAQREPPGVDDLGGHPRDPAGAQAHGTAGRGPLCHQRFK